MLINANALHIPLRDESVQCIVTSPPYWGLRDYGVKGQLGLEPTPQEYIANMVQVFMECRRVLKPDGVMFVNIGDTFAAARSYQVVDNKYKDVGNKIGHKIPPGLKPKDIVGIPWMLAFALRDDGWYFRQDIIWNKPNPMPESVKDRCTKAHEYVFLLTKSQRYYWDQDAVKEKCSDSCHTWKTKAAGRKNSEFGKQRDGAFRNYKPEKRNLRSVWTIPAEPTPEAHFATFPQKLVEPCILAGSRVNDIVMDPFGGSGTVELVAHRLRRRSVLLELSKSYLFDIALPKVKAETAQMRMFC